MKIVIDTQKANLSPNKLWRGAGMISANNSSRLLLDYKADNPEKYYEIINYVFGENGINANHLKIEMGADINSSSGTEPCIMRFEDELPDVTRGAGFQIASDVKKRYPDVTLDMLYWSEPAWVTNSDDVYAARYRWYKETLKAVFFKYGLKFDYVSVSRNERAIDAEWIKYIAKMLKSEKDCPYDFSKIKVVAADEENSWHIADLMAIDKELRDSIDVIGTHYTSHSTDNAKLMSEKYGKELWFSEGSSPMTYSAGTSRFDGTGLSGINGVLDIANRIVAMYSCGSMTMYEYQPAVSSYYDGVTYCHKSLITACEPWSGHYVFESGYYMALHFSSFFKKGWSFIDNACYNDSKIGGDGHALVDTTYSYMTACNPSTEDYSTLIVNSTDKPISYEFESNSGKKLYMWETSGRDNGDYDENYFRKIGEINPEESNGSYQFAITVNPFSITTISTLFRNSCEKRKSKSDLFELPYRDDFNYTDEFLKSRGNAPKYTTDQGGAFEVEKGKLVQQITAEIKSMEWGWTPPPTTCLGDDRWYNYSITTEVKMEKSDDINSNFAGIGLRYSLACIAVSGYSLVIFENCKWVLRRNEKTVLTGEFLFDPYLFNKITLSVENDEISAYINDVFIAKYSDEHHLCAGRAALYSSLNKNCFDYIDIRPPENTPYYIHRYDNTDLCFEYLGNWDHKLMCGFSNYKRTLSKGKSGSALILRFIGSGFAIFGEIDSVAEIEISIDGEKEEQILTLNSNREAICSKNSLKDSGHIVEIRIVSGELNIDGVEILEKSL